MAWAKDRFFQLTPPWIRPDKREHLLGCAFLFCLCYFLLSLPPPLCALNAFACGLLWEIKDGFWNDGFSWKDLIADCIGIGVMWSIIV